jgi:23S rRNA pseudouridine1911/1915/1917 synthase
MEEDWKEDNIEQNETVEENSDDLYEHYRFVADKGQNLLRVDRFLVDRITGASRNRIQQAAEVGFIHANGQAVKVNYKVTPFDIITVLMDSPKREVDIIPEDIPLNIVYEDDELMVVNKPPGLVVHPGHGNYMGTLVNGIAWHLLYGDGQIPPLEVPPMTDDPRLGLVHRIDKDTSGLLVIAKTPEAKSHLSYQFYKKTTQRQYVALVWGNVKEDEGRIEGNVGRDPNDKLRMTVFPDGNLGKTAVTHYKVLERFGYTTLVQCILETGRTHQIRVHMKYIGHTLFNDERYGGHEILKGNKTAKYAQFIDNCFKVCPRQALHAQTLGFVHPATGEQMFFESPIPDDMQQLIDKWRKI